MDDNIEVTQTSTADLLHEYEQLKAQHRKAEQQIQLLERRLAELSDHEPEFMGAQRSSALSTMYHVGEQLVLRRHPRPGRVVLYIGPVAPDRLVDHNHDLVLWHPAAMERDRDQAAAADDCLRLAVQHGLSVGVVSYSEHLFDRLRLREAECPEFGRHIEVLLFQHHYTGGTTEHTIELGDESQLDWPGGFCMLGCETEVAIGVNRDMRRERESGE